MHPETVAEISNELYPRNLRSEMKTSSVFLSLEFIHPATLSLEFAVFCQLHIPKPSLNTRYLLKSPNKVCKNMCVLSLISIKCTILDVLKNVHIMV